MTYTRGTDLANCPEYCKHRLSDCAIQNYNGETCPRELHDDQRLRLMEAVVSGAIRLADALYELRTADRVWVSIPLDRLAAYDKEHTNA